MPWGNAFRDEDFTAARDRSRLHWWLLIGCFGYIAAEIGYEYFHRRDVLVPFLDWLLRPGGVLEPLLPSAFGKRLGRTILTDVFAVILGWCLVRRYFRPMSRHELERGEWFVLLCGLAALALQTLYVQFYDVYLIQFLPFAVFALGRASREWPTWCKVSTGVLCAVMLCISSLWTRGNLEQAKASWQAAEVARSAGGLPEDIAGNMTWSCYNGAFDAWIRSIGGLDATANYSGDNRMHAAFFSFLGQRFERANYSVSSSHPHTGKKAWREFGQFEYRDKRLQPRTIYLLGRVTSE